MKRQLQGLVFLLSALFLANAAHCGVVGRCVGRATVWLIGSHGLDLFVGALAAIGLVLTGILAFVVRTVRKRARPSNKRTTGSWGLPPALGNRFGVPQPVRTRAITVQARSVSSAPPAPPCSEPVKPTLRAPIKQQEVVGGLKYLGYSKGEIDSVIGRLKGSTEEQLRMGIKLLTGAAA